MPEKVASDQCCESAATEMSNEAEDTVFFVHGPAYTPQSHPPSPNTREFYETVIPINLTSELLISGFRLSAINHPLDVAVVSEVTYSENLFAAHSYIFHFPLQTIKPLVTKFKTGL